MIKVLGIIAGLTALTAVSGCETVRQFISPEEECTAVNVLRRNAAARGVSLDAYLEAVNTVLRQVGQPEIVVCPVDTPTE